MNMVYRAYRYPYNFVPQLEKPEERMIKSIDNEDYRLPGAKSKEFKNFTKVQGTQGYQEIEGLYF